MSAIEQLISTNPVHSGWKPILVKAMATMDSTYLESLLDDRDWLPGVDRLLAAFALPPNQCRYIIFGESPYPRAESANGIAFYDAVVGDLWSEQGLSKAVNRATSLRNLIKTMLLAQGLIEPGPDQRITPAMIATIDKSGLVPTLAQLFQRLAEAGVLLCNATPVLHAARKVPFESRYWQPFIACLLDEIAREAPGRRPTLVLWGKIAEQISAIESSQQFQQIRCEHPYNLSFIHNPQMLKLFAELRCLG